MTRAIQGQIDRAQNYFLPLPAYQLEAALSFAADPAAGPQKGMSNVPAMFQPNGNTTGSVMQFKGALPAGVSQPERDAFGKLLDDQIFYLTSGMGLVTAVMTRKYQNDPVQWGNPLNWLEPLSNLPASFYTTMDLADYEFKQRAAGTRIATNFLFGLVGWASGAGLVGPFTGFLSQLGKQIELGVRSAKTSMQTYHLSFSYQPIQDSIGRWKLVSTAEYYFITFTQTERTVYSSCASAEMFDFYFKYRKGSIVLNWDVMSADVNKDILENWRTVVHTSTKNDVEKSRNYFSAFATPEKT